MLEKHILVLHTGGTISMKENKETGGVSTDGENPIAQVVNVPGVQATCEIKELFQVPSPHITIDHMMTLKAEIEAAHADGIVITHGTDTMEETAFFLHLVLGTATPVVITGAMRSSNEISADGMANFTAAVKTAASEEAVGKGVLVVMNDTIHHAGFVTKTNTGSLESFQSVTGGPLGTVLKHGPHFYGQPPRTNPFKVQRTNYHIPVLKAYAGMDGFLLKQLFSCDGVVIEAMGQGNVPPEAAKVVPELIQAGVPVVIVSRCVSGIVQPVYAYEGGGAALKQAGALFAGGLNGQKARLKLIAALSAGHREELPLFFPS